MKHYKQELQRVNSYIKTHILDNVTNPILKDIITHALDGGKRLRSILVIVIGNKLNKKVNLEKLASSIELFHTCSLIIDDMPCMDNDHYRRGKETLHFKYGITNAQLIVQILLKLAFKLLCTNIQDIKCQNIYDDKSLDNIAIEIYKNINKNMGVLGASGGQFIDTCPINSFITKNEYKKNYKSLDKLLNLIYLKTTTFFEISFVAAYLLSGGNQKNLDKVFYWFSKF